MMTGYYGNGADSGMMGNTSYGWMMSEAGYRWMTGSGTASPGWMTGALPSQAGHLSPSGTGPRQITAGPQTDCRASRHLLGMARMAARSSCRPAARESRAILDLLYGEITRPQYTVRFRWEPDSVAVWDNRATSHLAPTDIEHLDAQRTLHRVTAIGEVPVGPDDREPELVAGQPFTDKHVVVADG